MEAALLHRQGAAQILERIIGGEATGSVNHIGSGQRRLIGEGAIRWQGAKDRDAFTVHKAKD